MIVERGKVYLVGAGPGDPDLLTMRAARLVGAAEVIAYDELVSDEILELASDDVELVPVGRRGGGVRYHDDRIHPVVIERARARKLVIRLKGGDPMIFGRGGEEAQALHEAGVSYELVPGISAALAAASSTGIPLTHRGVSASVTFTTAHRVNGASELDDLPRDGTLVLYMGLSSLEHAAARLMARGRSPTTPVAIVSHASTANERVVRGSLDELADLARQNAIQAPALVIVGEVVAHAVVREHPTLHLGWRRSAK